MLASTVHCTVPEAQNRAVKSSTLLRRRSTLPIIYLCSEESDTVEQSASSPQSFLKIQLSREIETDLIRF